MGKKGNLTVSISNHDTYQADIWQFLSLVEGTTIQRLMLDMPDTPINREAFRRLSTCSASDCGCTGFTQSNDCPDPECFCNTDYKV